jgi:dihydropyrimidinase
VTNITTEVDTVVKGGRVVAEHYEGLFDVGIANGRITSIGEPGSIEGKATIDAHGCVVMPGGIDPHTHIQWPLANGNIAQDTFESATRLAAAWGTTTIVDFVPGQTGSLLAAADARLEQARGSVIDYSLHPVVTRLAPQMMSEIPTLIDMGLASFKVYTTYESRLESADIRRFIQVAGEAGGLPGFHAEHHALLEDALVSAKAVGGTGIGNFPSSRPGHTESASVREVTGYAAEFDSPVYIYHVSGLDGMAEIERARAAGTDVRAETCAHYLVFDDSVYRRDDGWKYVITPPIRSAADRAGMWQAVAEGRLDAVASDHCAYSLQDKTAGFDDFTAMEPGAPGIASRMPLLWHFGVNGGRLSERQFVNINATRPADALGLRSKGRIALGADADIVVWDPDLEWTWASGSPQASNGTDYDIYDGITGRGRPRITLSRGRSVFGGTQEPASGTGRFAAQNFGRR